jgi:hypothetical protein
MRVRALGLCLATVRLPIKSHLDLAHARILEVRDHGEGKGQRAVLGGASHASLALQGEAILQKLQQLLDRNISLVVATSSLTPAGKSTDLKVLAARGRCPTAPVWTPLPFLAGTMGRRQIPSELQGVGGKGSLCFPRIAEGRSPWLLESAPSGEGASSSSQECHLPQGRAQVALALGYDL